MVSDIRDLKVAQERPELTILSTILLGKQAKPFALVPEFAAGVAATRALDQARANIYSDLILRLAGKAAPKVLEP